MLLIVDDDPAFLQQAQEQLDIGKGILFAGNANQAKSLMVTVGSEFSVVMVDLDLPGADGFSLIQEMRSHFPDLPVIAISGVVQEHVLETAKRAGAADTLRKPISPEWNRAIARVRSAARK